MPHYADGFEAQIDDIVVCDRPGEAYFGQVVEIFPNCSACNMKLLALGRVNTDGHVHHDGATVYKDATGKLHVFVTALQTETIGSFRLIHRKSDPAPMATFTEDDAGMPTTLEDVVRS